MAATQKLVILHTNDIHSFIEQTPKIATVIKRLRNEYMPEEVLTIDCGDHMDRMRMETEGTDGLVNIQIMNETGYEAIVLGNNEGLTFTPNILSENYSQFANFTVLGSNLYDMSQGEIPSWMKPYQLIQKGKLTIALIGVTANFYKFYKLLGWDSRDPLEITKALVKQLRDKVDIVVVLSHLGLPLDQRMAEEINGIDCIFGGHTHHLLEEPMQVGSTYICATGKFGQYVGELELQYDLEKKSLTFVNGRCIDVTAYPNDPAIEEIIVDYTERSKIRLSQVCSNLKQSLNIQWDSESSLGNLLAAGVRKHTHAEIGIVNAGQIIHDLSEGEITQANLLEICPSPINPCRMLLLGRDIKQALEESLLREFIDLPIRGFGFRGKVLGSLCLDGVRVEYNPSFEAYEKITGIWINEVPLVENQEYVVGSLDMFTFKVGYTSLAKGREIEYFLPEFIRDVLHKELVDTLAIDHSKRMRWFAY